MKECVSIISGIKAKTEICCSEEAAVIYWGLQPWTERLSAGWVKLARSLLVQVNKYNQGRPLPLQIGFYKACITIFLSPSVGAIALSSLMRWGWEKPSRQSPSCLTCFTSISSMGPFYWWCLCPRSLPGSGSSTPGPLTWMWWSTLATSWAGK